MPDLIQQFDLSTIAAVHSLSNVVLDWLTSVVSTLTWAGWCWWLLAAILWFRGYRVQACQLACVLIVCSVEAEFFKHFVHRPRPSVMFPQFVHQMIPDIMPGKGSFPSGHTMLTAAVAFAVLWQTRGRWQGWLILLVAILVGYSRIYAGLHWPSDVVGGFILAVPGVVIGMLITQLIQDKTFFLQTGPSSSRLPHFDSIESKL